MDIKNLQKAGPLYVVFRESNEIAAVFTSRHRTEKYVDHHKSYFPDVPVNYIYTENSLRMYNLYPVQEMDLLNVEKIVNNIYLKTTPKNFECFPEEKFDGYILVLENFYHTILGTFDDIQSAEIFADEYLAVFPHHVVVFIKYRKNIVFQNIWEEENGKIKFLF